MSSDADLFKRGPGGFRKGQATHVPSGKRAKDYAILAIFGKDGAKNLPLLKLCELVCTYDPACKMTKNQRDGLNKLARTMLTALRDRPAWLERLVAVRMGEAFRIYMHRGSPSPSIDPVGSALAYLLQLQEDGRLGPVSAQHLLFYVTNRLDQRGETAAVPTTQTLTKNFISRGGKMDRKRGRKAGNGSKNLPWMTPELLASLPAQFGA